MKIERPFGYGCNALSKGCVCVCVCEREKERERVSVTVCLCLAPGGWLMGDVGRQER